MGKFFTEIPDLLIPWIQQQKMFWVATAPLSPSGHVNVSPKGFEGTFHVVNERKVWYEDLTGSGIETTAHLRENGRLTIMFCAFEGPPRITRLFGTGTVHEFDTPEYNALIPLDKRQPGSRSVIVLDIHKVGTSCGYSIPFFTFKSNRMVLHKGFAWKEGEDIKAESAVSIPATAISSTTDAYTSATSNPSNSSPNSSQPLSEPPLPEFGAKAYWKNNNQPSIDGLPGLLTAFKSTTKFDESIASRDWGQDDESLPGDVKSNGKEHCAVGKLFDVKLFAGFVLGVLVSGVWANLRGVGGFKI